MELRSGYQRRDAASFINSLPLSCVDVTITSPPYGAMKDYGDKKQIGYGQSYEDYLMALSKTLGLLYAKTKVTGSLWVVVDTFKEKSQIRVLPFDLADRLKKFGWQLQDVIIWNKTKTLPWSRPGQFRRTFEYILFFAKNKGFKYFINRIKEPDNLKEWWVKYPERYSPEGKVPTTIWTFPIPVQGSWSRVRFRHFCPFPAALVERILLLTTEAGDCVLDPFAGSGMVLAQAKVMGRKFIGCDVSGTFRKQFHGVVARHIGEKWSKNKKLLAKTDANRQLLAETIRKLRQVKFPKALYKELRKSLGAQQLAGVKAILAKAVPLNGNASKHSFSHVLVYFLCARDAPFSLIEEEARKLVLRPPLSKYGISSEVNVERIERFWKSRDGCLLAGQTLFIYPEGKTHFAESEIRIAEGGVLPIAPWKRLPPIVTNIEVRQKPVRTWVPEKLDT